MEANSSLNTSDSPVTDNITPELPEWAKISFILFLSTVTLLGVPGNGIILIVQWKNRDKSSTDVLVSTLSAFELVCSGFNSTLMIIRNIPDIWRSMASVVACCIHAYTMYVTSISSSLLLTAIALDRYFQICKPMNTVYTKRIAKRVCVVITAASLILSLFNIFLFTFNENRLTCVKTSKFPVLTVAYTACLATAFVTMFVVVMVCYTKVALFLHRRQRQKAALRLAVDGTSRSMANSAHPPANVQKDSNLFCSNRNKVHPQTQMKTVLDGSKNDEDITKLNNDVKQKHAVETRRLHEEATFVRRTTLTTVLITMIYITSWVLHWLTSAIASRKTVEGLTAVFLTTHLYMVNCVANPIVFISLSSKFRKRARLFFGLR